MVARDGHPGVVPVEGLVEGVEAEALPGLPGRGVVARVEDHRRASRVGRPPDHRVHPDVVVPVADQHGHRLVLAGLVELAGDLLDPVRDLAVEHLAGLVGVEQAEDQAAGAFGEQPTLHLPPAELRGHAQLGERVGDVEPDVGLHPVGVHPPGLRQQDHDERQAGGGRSAGPHRARDQLRAARRTQQQPQADRGQADQAGAKCLDPGEVDELLEDPALLRVGVGRNGGVPHRELGRRAGRGLADHDVDPDPGLGARAHVRQVGTEIQAHVAVEVGFHDRVVAGHHHLGLRVAEQQHPGRQRDHEPGQREREDAQHPTDDASSSPGRRTRVGRRDGVH